MKDKQNKIFSNEIVEFSEIINDTFNNVSLDIKLITSNVEKINKIVKSELDKLKKENLELRNIISNLKTNIREMDIKVKKKAYIIPEQAKVRTNNDEIKGLINDISELRLSIQNIEKKLKIS